MHSKYYRNIITSYFIVGCVTIALFSFVIQLNIGKISVNHINDINLQTLTQTSNTGTYIIESIHKKFLKEISSNAVVVSALHSQKLKVDEKVELYNFINNVLSENRLIDSIYVINFKTGMTYSNLTKQKEVEDFCDKDIIARLLTSDSNVDMNLMTFARQVSLYQNETVVRENIKYISIIFRVDKSSAFVVNLLQDEFAKLVSVSSVSNTQQTFVLDKKGNALTGSTPSLPSTLSDIHKLISENNKKMGVFEYDNSNVNYILSDYLEYTYLIIYDKKSLPVFTSKLILNIFYLLFYLFFLI